MKRSPIRRHQPKGSPLRSSAKGENCTFNVAGVCNYNSETVALCHLPFIGGAGIAMKTDDFCAAYGCSCCHDWIDCRSDAGRDAPESERMFYASRALIRTLRRMVEKGLINIAGMAA